MPVNNDFRFKLSVSTQTCTHKPSRNGEWYRQVRFSTQELTIPKLLNYATNGYAFCHCFDYDDEFGVPKKEHFVSTSTLFFDIDDSDKPLDEYINNLKFKPTFAYTTFNNEIHGYRFRLGYVFNRDIVGKQNFTELYHAVAAANQFEHLDSLPCSQISFGTHGSADTYESEFIYSPNAFDEYKKPIELDENKSQTSSSTTINGDILHDIRNLNFDDFFHKYAPLYYNNYKASMETPLILDESEMFFAFPEQYYAVKHKVRGGMTLKWGIGSDRKRKMFFTAKIMLHNVPSLSIENLLFNLVCEREWYYNNSDNKISNDVLIVMAKNAFKYDYTLNQTKHPSFRVNKSFWSEQGITPRQAVNYIRGFLKVQLVKQYFNPYISYSDNLKKLKDNNISISLRTLQRMVTRGDIPINKEIRNITHTYLQGCRSDVTNPVTNGILQLLREDGTRTQGDIADILEMDIRTVKRYFKEMKDVLIRREGNNRTGRWVVIDDSVIEAPMVAEMTTLS